MKRTSVLIATTLLLSAGAKEMNLFQQWKYNRERKEAAKEWQTITKGRDANYQQALITFEQFDKTYAATAEEKELFRHWKKSVRNTVTPDGIIFDPHQYEEELNQFRTLRPAIPNPEEEPVFYPAPAETGTRISLQVPNGSNAGDWKSMGYRGNPRKPGGGATGNGAATGVAIDPINPAIVYTAVRNGGLWKSTDYGVTYTPMTDYFQSPLVEGIGIGTNNSQVLYLSQPGRIWFSDDGGMSWEDRSNGYTGSADEIHVDPQDANRALAASDKGLYLTTDAGRNWSKVMDGVFREIETTSNWHTIATNKDGGTNPNASFFISTDRGSTWTEKTVCTDRNPVGKVYLAFCDLSTPENLTIYAYLVQNGNTPTIFKGLFRSNNRGETYTEVKAPGYAYPNGPVPLKGDSITGYTELTDSYGSVNPSATSSWVGEFFCDPTNPNNLVTMREKCWYSVNGGQTWAYGPSYGEVAWADRRFATSNPTKDSLYFCDDGGAWAIPFRTLFPWTGSEKVSVVSKNGNISAPEGTNLTTSTYNKEVFMTGGQDVGQVFQRNGKIFHTQLADVYRGKICPYNDSLYWTGDYTVKTGDTTSTQLYNQVEPDHFNSQRIYGFTKTGVLMRTRAGENAWQSPVGRATVYGDTVDLSSTGVTVWNGWTFEQSRANGERAFMGDEKGKQLFMTENLSADKPIWTKVVSAPALTRYRIATHPFNEKLVAVAGDKAVWLSRDKGTTWEELEGYPASGTINIFFDQNTAEGLYVANSMTVWYRDETLSNWIEFNRGLPLQNISEMEIRHYADGDSRLWISKYGRGVWSTPLYSSKTNKPIRADFTLSGVSVTKGVFSIGDTVQLNDLSAGSITNRSWRVTGAGQTLVAGNDSMPKFGFTTAGTYAVSLTVTGPSGVDSCAKVGYIRIADKLKAVDSIPATGTGGAWYLGIKSVTVNGVTHGSNGNNNAFYEDVTGQTPFINLVSDSADVTIAPTQNDATWGVSYARVYVDFNNSGSFDSTELVYRADSRLQGHSFRFKAPQSVVTNKPLRMRVLVNRSKLVTDAYQSQIDQGQAEDHTIIFTTPAPTVTLTATAIGTDSLSFSGTVSGANGVIDQGFIYTANKSVPTMNESARISSGTKSFVSKVNIPQNDTYYVRAYVVDQFGTWLSEVDTVVPATFTRPILDVLTPTYDSITGKWTAVGRVHAENGNVQSATIEYGENGAFDNSSTLSLTGIRNQWDTVTAELDLGRYVQANYRIRATIDGKTYVSPVRKFSSERGLYAYWTFDETGSIAFDYSGNNRIATLGTTLTRVSDDRNGSALAFDSIGDLATIGLANLPQPFTLMFRVKRTAQSSVAWATILSGDSRRVELEGSTNTRKLGVQYQGKYNRPSTWESPLGEWNSVAMVASNDSIKIFVNGTYHSTLAAAGYTLPLSTFGQTGYSMLGLLDEVKVYTKPLDSAGIADAMKMVQKVSFATVGSCRENSAPFELIASSSKGSAVRLEIVSGDSAATVTGTTFTPVKPGNITIRAIADGTSWLFPDSVEQTITVLKNDVVALEKPVKSGVIQGLVVAPNPVTHGSAMVFQIPGTSAESGEVQIFDVVGNRIANLPLKGDSEGRLTVQWDLNTDNNVPAANGTYSAVIRTTGVRGEQRMARVIIGVKK